MSDLDRSIWCARRCLEEGDSRPMDLDCACQKEASSPARWLAVAAFLVALCGAAVLAFH